MNGRLAASPMPALIRLLPKGWIFSDLFLEWFQNFIESIHTQGPVVLFMDYHASHITPDVLCAASDNDIHIVKFPAHTPYLLQPLDVGVYRPFKESWRMQLVTFMNDRSGEKPDSFAKCGIFPFNKNAVSDEAIAASIVTERKADQQIGGEKQATTVEDVLTLPV
ncbi:hypothetical protein PR048_011703 [Dryococelus australis]|uniref:DDE-1 domain-containing protein n=1 Tax=Dryococelus australis TaxID=614101 RepID=A0ABQ9HMU6_9NEOP|nr:hypothetical protein PR048_011703 [Dryococelus australis]